ncbi:MAG: thioredoxin TrxA [Pseudomonadota bacterium]|nr:thioredoxin TrxA [Pseudomonadota bacterium]MED5274687.1 thioredoxin TrxA [Pseudomonadota bacterium]MED5430296.1 thioredoxin TrxA [Pseudomonadota bacterium]|tara:strand:- start:5 stop:328 length:324 start_codon:yes stop_codon:yes gene_type:complete
MSNVIEITDASFEEEVLKSDIPVLLDFWAEWCGPCKSLSPIVDETSKDYEGKIKFAKINVDENADTTKEFGIRGIPTLILFKNGEKKETKVGLLTKSELTSFLDNNI